MLVGFFLLDGGVTVEGSRIDVLAGVFFCVEEDLVFFFSLAGESGSRERFSESLTSSRSIVVAVSGLNVISSS